MREITDHHDGHGLNEALKIRADEAGPGGASHHYTVSYETENTGNQVADVQFQKGPRDVEGSTPGATDSAILGVVIDRLRSFNEGEFRCRENAVAITHLETALLWMKKRADERAKRGVLGTYNK